MSSLNATTRLPDRKALSRSRRAHINEQPACIAAHVPLPPDVPSIITAADVNQFYSEESRSDAQAVSTFSIFYYAGNSVPVPGSLVIAHAAIVVGGTTVVVPRADLRGIVFSDTQCLRLYQARTDETLTVFRFAHPTDHVVGLRAVATSLAMPVPIEVPVQREVMPDLHDVVVAVTPDVTSPGSSSILYLLDPSRTPPLTPSERDPQLRHILHTLCPVELHSTVMPKTLSPWRRPYYAMLCRAILTLLRESRTTDAEGAAMTHVRSVSCKTFVIETTPPIIQPDAAPFILLHAAHCVCAAAGSVPDDDPWTPWFDSRVLALLSRTTASLTASHRLWVESSPLLMSAIRRLSVRCSHADDVATLAACYVDLAWREGSVPHAMRHLPNMPLSLTSNTTSSHLRHHRTLEAARHAYALLGNKPEELARYCRGEPTRVTDIAVGRTGVADVSYLDDDEQWWDTWNEFEEERESPTTLSSTSRDDMKTTVSWTSHPGTTLSTVRAAAAAAGGMAAFFFGVSPGTAQWTLRVMGDPFLLSGEAVAAPVGDPSAPAAAVGLTQRADLRTPLQCIASVYME